MIGNYGIRKISLLPGIRCARLAFHCVRIDIFASEALEARYQIRTDTLRYKVRLVSEARVGVHCARIRTHRHARHAFDTAADCEIRLA